MKYALVTGASRGIGRAVALRLANEYPVIINYHSNSESANEVKELIEANGGYAELLPFDVADSQSIENAIDLWEQRHPDDYISVLVNNAGIRRDNVMFMMANEEWHDVLNTNLRLFKPNRFNISEILYKQILFFITLISKCERRTICV
jgi:3-oxoacyl-[acyl-carrier protein] reductase